MAVPKQLLHQKQLPATLKRTNAVLKPARVDVIAVANAVKAVATDATNVVAVMADAAAVAVLMAKPKDAQAVKDVPRDVQKADLRAGLKAEAASAVSAAQSHAENSALNNVKSSAANHAAKARSSASHAYRVKRASLEKAAALSAQGVNAASAPSGAIVPREMPPSKTSRWPTRLPWQRQRAALQLVLVKTSQMAERAHSAMNATAGATTEAASAGMRAIPNNPPNRLPTLMQPRSQ